MLLEDPEFANSLRGIAYKICKDCYLIDDLLQEARLYLWKLEKERPGQTKSWYLQGCQFHLLNYVRGGRSIDAMKRQSNAVRVDDHSERSEYADQCFSDNPVFSEVNANDMSEVLHSQLPSIGKEVFAYIQCGYRLHEIARMLNVSTRTVSKYKRCIAEKAIDLGFQVDRCRTNPAVRA